MARSAGVSRSTMWARVHPERVNAARKAAQAKAWREAKRADWLQYCQAYRSAWPGGQPVGFGRWIAEGHYDRWSLSPAELLAAPNRRSQQAARASLESAHWGYATQRVAGGEAT